jgi:hypothetical protein
VLSTAKAKPKAETLLKAFASETTFEVDAEASSSATTVDSRAGLVKEGFLSGECDISGKRNRFDVRVVL